MPITERMHNLKGGAIRSLHEIGLIVQILEAFWKQFWAQGLVNRLRFWRPSRRLPAKPKDWEIIWGIWEGRSTLSNHGPTLGLPRPFQNMGPSIMAS